MNRGDHVMREKPEDAGQLTSASFGPVRSSGRKVLAAVGIAAGVALVLVVLWISIRVWLLTFAAILLAILLRALSCPISRWTRMPPAAAVTLVFVVLLGLAALMGVLVAPRISNQLSELSERLPKAVEAIRERIDANGWGRLVPTEQASREEVISGAGQAVSTAANVFSRTMNGAVGMMVVLFVGLYLAASPEPYISGFIRLFPIGWRDRVQILLDEIGTTLRHWLLAQIVSMAVVGTLIGVGLKLLGVPLALTLGLVAGLVDFIPIIGPLVSAVPAVLLAFLISPVHALYVVLLFVFVNSVIESHLLVPLVQKFAIRMPPAVAVMALMLGGTLFDLIGVLLAIPLTAAAMVLIRRLYIEGLLGDKEPPKPNVEKTISGKTDRP